MEGFRAGKKENKLGSRASDTAEVMMEDCWFRTTTCLGSAARDSFRRSRFSTAGESRLPLWVWERRWALTRPPALLQGAQQFGRPIAEFQAIQFHLAEMATRISASEAAHLAAAVAMDRGERVTRIAAQAKLMPGETAVFCAERGVQIHGGYGYHQGLSGREVLPRLQDLHDRGRDQRDPASGDSRHF